MSNLSTITRPEATLEIDDEATTTTSRSAPRWQRRCLAVGGALFTVGNLLHPLQHNDAAYEKPTWQPAHLTIFFSLPLILLGLPALHRAFVGRVSQRAATLTTAALTSGLVAIAPGAIIESFVAPMIGHEQMEELTSGGMAIVDSIGGIAFLGGSIALGWFTHQARVRPRWSGPTILATAVVMVPMIAFTGPIAGAIIIAATALYGSSLVALALC